MTAKQPDISVIVPVYNAAPFLEQCLDSILGQSGVSFELLLVDDGSTDGSGDICDAYGRRDERVRVVHQANAGVSAARNRGIALSRGAFTTFVDADDYLVDGALASLWREQNAHDADFVRARLEMVFESGLPAGYLGGRDMFRPPVKGFAYLENSGGKPAICFMGGPVALLMRSKLLRERGVLFREGVSYGEDALFILALAKCGGTYRFVDEVVYIYRRQAVNSLTSTYSPAKSGMLFGAVAVLNDLRRHLEGGNDPASVAMAIGDMHTGFLIRYLVACAADSIAEPNGDAYTRFKTVFESPTAWELLRYYDPGSAKGKTRLLPYLIRLRMTRTAFALCRRKAAKRYGRELAQLLASAP